MKILIPLSILAFALGIGAGLYFFNTNTPESSSSSMNYPIGGEFTLHDGEKKVRLSDSNGKVRLIFFGYTSCPDICPSSLAFIATSLKQLTDKERKNTQVLFISVDPDRDTAEKLRDYTKYFSPDILGITGSKEEIDDIVKKYGAAYRKVAGDSAMGYSVDHSASVYVINPEGKVVDMLPHGLPVEEITKAIRKYQPH